MCSSDIFLGVLAILFPPLPVWVKRGICGADSFINILLFVLGYIPGLIHAWYIIAKFPDDHDYEYDNVPQHDSERGYQHGGERVRYIIIDRPSCGHGQGQHQQKANKSQRGTNYGTNQQSNGGRSGNNSNQPASYAAAVSRPAPQQQGVTKKNNNDTNNTTNNNGEGGSDGTVPPSYADVVAGDHKIQTQD